LIEGEGAGRAYDLTWKRMSPGHFSVSRDLEEGTLIRGAIQAGAHALPFGPVMAGSSTEWAFDGTRLDELRVMSNQTGGRELLKLSDAWVRPTMERDSNIRLPLLLALLFFILLDALVTRTGWALPNLGWPQALPAEGEVPVIPPKGKVVKKKTAVVSTPMPKKAFQKKPVVKPDLPEKPAAERSSRFNRAKNRK